jgi:hypothetical protein
MKDPRNLRDRFEEMDSFSDDPKMDWSIMGPALEARISKEEKRKGILWWMLGGLSIIVGWGILSYTHFADLSSEASPAAAVVTPGDPIRKQAAAQVYNYDDQGNFLDSPSALLQQESAAKRTKEEIRLYNTLLKEQQPLESPGERTRKAPVKPKEQTDVQVESTFTEAPYQNNASDHMTPIKAEPIVLEVLRKRIELLEMNRHYLSAPDLEGGRLLPVAAPSSFLFSWNLGSNTSSVFRTWEHSSPQIGLSMGAFLRFDVQKDFYLGGGINYDHSRFVSALERTDTVNLYRPNTVDTIFQSSFGAVSTVKDSVRGTRQQIFRNHNSFSTLSIPLFVGGRLKVGSQEIGMEGGVQLNILRRIQGRIVEDDFRVRNLEDNYRSSVRLGFFFSTYLRIPIAKHWSIDPYYRFAIDGSRPALEGVAVERIQVHQLGLGLSRCF